MLDPSLALGLIFTRRLVAASLIRFMAIAWPRVALIAFVVSRLGSRYRLGGIASAHQRSASAK